MKVTETQAQAITGISVELSIIEIVVIKTELDKIREAQNGLNVEPSKKLKGAKGSYECRQDLQEGAIKLAALLANMTDGAPTTSLNDAHDALFKFPETKLESKNFTSSAMNDGDLEMCSE